MKSILLFFLVSLLPASFARAEDLNPNPPLYVLSTGTAGLPTQLESTEPSTSVDVSSQTHNTAGMEYFKQKLLKSKGIRVGKEKPSKRDLIAVEGEGPVTNLTLESMIHDVVFYNPSVEKARLEWLSSLRVTRAAWGDYEPDFVGQFNYTKLNRENSVLESLQQGGALVFLQKRSEYKAGIEGKIFSGGAYNVGYTLADDNNNLTTNNQYQSFSGVTLKQPLFKGAWFGSPLSKIKSAKMDRGIAFHNFRTKLISILYEAESAYWNLAFAEDKYRAAGESVDIARRLERNSREGVKTGKMSRLDAVEAQAGLASRLGSQADAKQELVDAMNRLKLILSSDKISNESWIRTATPIYESSEEEEKPIDEAFLKEVLMVQPNYLARRYELDKEEIDLKARKDQSLPEVNANGSFGYTSLGQNAEEAWRKLNLTNHETWSAGVEVKIPLLFGVEGRNMYAAEKLKREAAQENLKSTGYEIESSLRALSRRVKALRERIENARSVTEYRQKLLEAEFSRLDAGKSTSRLIFEAEEKLSEAKQFEFESWVRHREAATQFAVYSGALLARRGLETLNDTSPILSETILHPNR